MKFRSEETVASGWPDRLEMIRSSAGSQRETGTGTTTAPLSIAAFRILAWSRDPDHEHWELDRRRHPTLMAAGDA